KLAPRRIAEIVAFERHQEDIAGFEVDSAGEAEAAAMTVGQFADGETILHHLPAVAAVDALVHAAMLLTVEDVRVLRIVRHAVNALAGRGRRGIHRRIDALVLRRPGLAAIVAAEEAGGGNARPDTVGILRVGENGVAAEAAESGRPILAPGLLVESVDRLPGGAAILAREQAGFRDAGEERAVREMQFPYLVDEAAAALEQAAEILLGDQAVMLGIAAVLGTIARRGIELFPVLHVVAGMKGDAIIRAVDGDVGAALVVANACRHRPAAQDEVLAPFAAISAVEDGRAFRRADDKSYGQWFLPWLWLDFNGAAGTSPERPITKSLGGLRDGRQLRHEPAPAGIHFGGPVFRQDLPQRVGHDGEEFRKDVARHAIAVMGLH